MTEFFFGGGWAYKMLFAQLRIFLYFGATANRFITQVLLLLCDNPHESISINRVGRIKLNVARG